MDIQITVSEAFEAEALAAWGSVVSEQPGESAASRAARGINQILRLKVGEFRKLTEQATFSASVSAAQAAALGRADAAGALSVSVS
jgi:hypothetical protein